MTPAELRRFYDGIYLAAFGAQREPLETWEDWSEAEFLAEEGSVEPPSRPLSNAVLAEARDVLSEAEDGCHLHLHDDET